MRSQSGLTVIEIAIASTIFAIVAYAMMAGASMGVRSERAVAQMVVESRALHDTCTRLEEELSNAAAEGIVHAVDEKGWSSLEFQMPFMSEAGLVWGVVDRALGSTEEERAREDFRLRYEAIELVDGSRQLVRRILDDEGDIVHNEIVVPELAVSGAPGFTVTDTGAVWILTIRYAQGSKAQAQEVVLHVTSRN
jgi:hypothetical protein